MHEFLKWAGYSLEAALLWRLLTWHAWRHFPLFSCYFLILLLRQGLNAYLETRYGFSSPVYARGFWLSSNLTDVWKLLVAWEVFRKAFRPGTDARRFAGVLLAATLVGFSVFYLLGGAHDTNFFVAVGLNFSLVVAIWVFGVLALAQYYNISLGRNLWGIAMGLGLFSSTAVVNFSALGLNEEAFPVFSYVRPASFVISLLIWVCCLWSHRPPPAPPPPASSLDSHGSTGPLDAARETVGRALRLNPPRSSKD